MRLFRLTAAGAVVLTAAFAASAQQPPASRPAPAGAQGAAAIIPESKIAIINTDAFADTKSGITRLVNAMGGVDREFQPRRTELQTLQTRYNQLVEEIKKIQPLADQTALSQKAEQAETLKQDIERKQQDAQRAFEKRMREAINPIYDDIGKALEGYARQRGITVIFDASKLGGIMFITNDSLDITREFVVEYNRRNPATASTTAPAR